MSGSSGASPGRPSGRRALAVTASNRAAAGVYEDRGGPLIVVPEEATSVEAGADVEVILLDH